MTYSLSQMAVIKTMDDNKCWQGRAETGALSYTASGNVKRCHCGKQFGRSSKS